MTHEDGVGGTHRQQGASPSTPQRRSPTLPRAFGGPATPSAPSMPVGPWDPSVTEGHDACIARQHSRIDHFPQRPCYADVFGQHPLLALQCLDAFLLLCWRQGESHPSPSLRRRQAQPRGAVRRWSSSLDVMAHSPLAVPWENPGFCCNNITYHGFTGGILLR